MEKVVFRYHKKEVSTYKILDTYKFQIFHGILNEMFLCRKEYFLLYAYTGFISLIHTHLILIKRALSLVFNDI